MADLSLYEEFPSPCYVMFEDALEANLQLLNLVQKEAGVSIICALKGFAFWRFMSFLCRCAFLIFTLRWHTLTCE